MIPGWRATLIHEVIQEPRFLLSCCSAISWGVSLVSVIENGPSSLLVGKRKKGTGGHDLEINNIPLCHSYPTNKNIVIWTTKLQRSLENVNLLLASHMPSITWEIIKRRMLLLLLSHFSHVRLCCDPIDGYRGSTISRPQSLLVWL